MTARDTLAAAMHAEMCACGTPSHYHYDMADRVIAAVRGMPDAEVADLIGGRVECHPGRPVLYQVVGPTRTKR